MLRQPPVCMSFAVPCSWDFHVGDSGGCPDLERPKLRVCRRLKDAVLVLAKVNTTKPVGLESTATTSSAPLQTTWVLGQSGEMRSALSKPSTPCTPKVSRAGVRSHKRRSFRFFHKYTLKWGFR